MRAAPTRALDAISCARRGGLNVWPRASSTVSDRRSPANARAGRALLTCGAFYLTIDATPRAFPHSFGLAMLVPCGEHGCEVSGPIWDD